MTTSEAHPQATGFVDVTHGVDDDIADETRSMADQVRGAVGDAIDHLPDALETARGGADQVAERIPGAVHRVRLGADETTTALQTMPDPTLRLFAAASIGMATGLYLAGAPRLIVLAAITPAVLAGGAMATRPESILGGAR